MIQERTMLVNFSASTWGARKHDKKLSREVTSAHNVDEKVARVNKVLLAREEVKKYEAVAQEARLYHKSLTLPWLDNGTRILPATTYFEYVAGMQKKEGEFRAIVENFLRAYPHLLADARIAMNSMFNEEDYPNEEKIQRKFGWAVTFLPMPDAKDFRVSLNDVEEKRIRESLEKTITNNLKAAAQDLWTRFFEAVKRIHETTKLPDKQFQETMMTKAAELCALLPKLNIMDDPNLEEARKTLEKEILVYSSEDLRKYADARKEVATISGELTKIAQDKLSIMEDLWA